MMSDEENLQILQPKRDVRLRVLVAECIFAAVILLAVTVIRFAAPRYFEKIRRFYTVHFTPDTSVSEVLGDGAEDGGNADQTV